MQNPFLSTMISITQAENSYLKQTNCSEECSSEKESSYLGEVWSRKWELNINSYLTLPLEHRSISWFKLIYRKNKTALGEHQIKEQWQVKFILLSSHWLKVKKKKTKKHCYSILRKIICIYNKKTKKLFLPWEIM